MNRMVKNTNYMMYRLLLVGLVLLITTSACFNSLDFSEEAIELEFSVDTLKFDTVFTDRGTATRHFKVYNPSKLNIRTKISLGKNTPFFRMNVDGYPGDKIDEIEILAHDSIYVFVEAHIDPQQPLEISPYIVEDFIRINTHGIEQDVKLEAYGQDAIYLTPDSYQGKQVYLSCDMQEVVWDDERPFILNGILVIDSCALKLAEGTRLYVHGGVQRQDGTIYNDGAIIVRKHGKIHSLGSLSNPVIISGDRLESEFIDVSGQWNGIRFIEGSSDNMLEHSIVKDAIIGLLVDSLSELSIKKSIVQNSAMSNLYASTGKVTAVNSLFANSGDYSVLLSGGGQYDFTYVTMGNHGTGSGALYFSNLYPISRTEYTYIPIHLNIRNSLISAGVNDALTMALNEREFKAIDLSITHTGIKSKDLSEGEFGFPDFYEHFESTFRLYSGEPLFKNPINIDYQLDSLSVGIGNATPLLEVKDDIRGELRDALHPDAGCYEYLD